MAKIEDGSNSTSEADVSLGRLAVAGPGYNGDGTVLFGGPNEAGGVTPYHENDAGIKTGVRDVRSPEVSIDFRERVSLDTLLFSDTFNSSNQNTHIWNHQFVTLSMGTTGPGFLQIGTVQGTTNSHGAWIKTYQYFPIYGAAPTYFEFVGGQAVATMVANEAFLAGFGAPPSVTASPADGCYFRITNSGIMGEITSNGAVTQTGILAPLTDIVVGTYYKFGITLSEREASFWINDVKQGTLVVPAAQGQMMVGGSQPVFFQKYNTGSVSNTNRWQISDVTVSQGDFATNKPWAHQQALAGLSAVQGQNGGTMGNTSNYANGAITSVAAGSNTASSVLTGLGGVGQMTAQVSNVAAAGDMIAQSYQNPTPSINISGRNLIITGVRISAMNAGAAVATTSTTLMWTLAVNHTTVSLATLEAGSFANGTTHAPRRVPLGFMTAPVGAVAGATFDKDIDHTFSTPIVVRPGEFIATTLRFIVGTATGSQAIVYTIMFEGYWE